MKRKIIVFLINLLLFLLSFLLFLCIPHTVWGDWDNDAVLVIRVFGTMGLLTAIPFTLYMIKEKKIINIFYNFLIVVFCIYKIVTTFI